MSILAWIEDQKRLKVLNAPKNVHLNSDSSKGLWTRCDKCGVILYIKHLKENQRVCFGCSYHLQMSSQERIENLLDKDSWRPLDETISPCDPLKFYDQKNYTDRLQDAQEKTGLQDAIQTGTGMVDGIPVALGVMDFNFMGGSMGSVVGEKLTRLIEYATQEGLTLLIVCASGGARMQEGVFSLMQMAKVSSALQIYQSCANLLYISILTSPTTGGVTASFAMLGDIIFAEPKALIAFAGRRVIEQTLREDLPDDFQTSEYMLHHGLVDLIVPRRFLRQALSETIRLYQSAPFKRAGRIPFGVQNPISFLTEEKVRRKWAALTSLTKGNKHHAQNKVLQQQPNGKTRRFEQTTKSKGHERKGKRDQMHVMPQRGQVKPIPFGSSKENLSILSNKQFFDKMRQSVEYREILTSFEMIFNLFSRENYTKNIFFGENANDENSVNRANEVLSSDKLKNGFCPGGVGRNAQPNLQFVHKNRTFSGSSYQNKESSKNGILQSFGSSVPLQILDLVDYAKKAKKDYAQKSKETKAGEKNKHFTNFLEVDTKKALIRIPLINTNRFLSRLYPNAIVSVFFPAHEKTISANLYETKTKEVKLKNLKLSQPFLLHRFKYLSEKLAVNGSTQFYKQLHFFGKDEPNGSQKISKSWRTNNGISKSDSYVKTTVHASTNTSLPQIYTNKLVSASKISSDSGIKQVSIVLNKESNRSSVGFKSTDLSKVLSLNWSTFDTVKNRAQVGNNGASEKTVTKDQANINFLNQAIELAATESVEWRAFYLHQQISKTTGFLEDFIQPVLDTDNKQQENLLFYRSICRSSF